MTFVFYDTETTGLDPVFDQILQFAAIRTDDELNVVETFSLRGRLLPHVLPSPGALLVTGVSLDSIRTCPLSHFEMMRQIRARLAAWSIGGAVFAGWNSLRFDEPFLRHAFYRSLLPVYQTQAGGNGRADIMRMVQVAAAVSPDSVALPLQDDGKAQFKLGPVAAANRIALDNAHEALADAGATVAMARLLRRRVPALWSRLLGNARKASVIHLIEDHPVLLLSETHRGRGYNFVVAPIAANPGNPGEWGVFDLQFDPAGWVDAPDEMLDASLAGNRRAIRKVAANAQPGLLPLEFCPQDAADDAPKIIRGGRLPLEVYRERSRIVREHPAFRGRVAGLLARQYADRPRPEHVEQRIYEGFPSRADEARMSRFHEADWPERLRIVEEVEDPRYRQLGRRIVATERLDLLGPERRQQYLEWRRERLLTKEAVPWRTIGRVRQEMEELAGGASEAELNALGDIRESLAAVEASLNS